jgi:hypothetical protein
MCISQRSDRTQKPNAEFLGRLLGDTKPNPTPAMSVKDVLGDKERDSSTNSILDHGINKIPGNQSHLKSTHNKTKTYQVGLDADHTISEDFSDDKVVRKRQLINLNQQSGSERIQSAQQARSYWSDSESRDFPDLLRSFGTDWIAIANHMQTKTAVMVCLFICPAFKFSSRQGCSNHLLGPELFRSEKGGRQARVGSNCARG